MSFSTSIRSCHPINLATFKPLYPAIVNRAPRPITAPEHRPIALLSSSASIGSGLSSISTCSVGLSLESRTISCDMMFWSLRTARLCGSNQCTAVIRHSGEGSNLFGPGPLHTATTCTGYFCAICLRFVASEGSARDNLKPHLALSV